MTTAPDIDLEKSGVYKVDWGKVSAGNFDENELTGKGLESEEAIEYVRKVLRTVAIQLNGMTLFSLMCSFFKVFHAILGNQIVLYASALVTIAFFVVMSLSKEHRTKAPLNQTYLMVGSISMMVFFGALAAAVPLAFVVTLIMAVSCAINGLLLGAHLA